MMEPLKILIFYGSILLTNAQIDPLVVSIKNGQIRGKTITTDLGIDVDTWYGIPFAKPPLGKLRFKRPEPPSNWEGILNTTEQVFSCYQGKAEFPNSDMMNSPEAKKYRVVSPLSEDCLYLNVISPKPRPEKAAVIVWLFGISFFQGSTTMGIYSYEMLTALQNVIIVAPQYRLGAFGFLYSGDENAPGNAGLYDQLLALQWVQDNIENFGGDPSKVTIMGNDAGGVSVGFHLISPLSEDLFLRGALLSGSPLQPGMIRDRSESIKMLNTLAESFNCSNNDNNNADLISCLQKIAPEDIVKKDYERFYTNFFPIVDGEFIVEKPSITINKPREKPVKDILMGTLSDEATFILWFLMPHLLSMKTKLKFEEKEFLQGVKILGSIFHRSDSLNKAIIQQYFNYDDPNNSFLNVKALESIYSDYVFHCPTNDFVHFVSKNNGNVYQYFFTSFLPLSADLVWIGANHMTDMGYLFANNLKNLPFPIPEQIKDVTLRMTTYFGNFVKTG